MRAYRIDKTEEWGYRSKMREIVGWQDAPEIVGIRAAIERTNKGGPHWNHHPQLIVTVSLAALAIAAVFIFVNAGTTPNGN